MALSGVLDNLFGTVVDSAKPEQKKRGIKVKGQEGKDIRT